MKWLFLFFLTSTNLKAADVTVLFDSLSSDRGEILYLLFSSKKGFPDKDRHCLRSGKISVIEAKKYGLVLSGLSKGDYALSVFHDENKNGKLDTNFLGIPKEGFAFSSNPTIYFGPPTFEKAKFQIEMNRTIKLEFIYF